MRSSIWQTLPAPSKTLLPFENLPEAHLARFLFLTPGHLFLHGFVTSEEHENAGDFNLDVGTSIPDMEKQLILKTLKKVNGNRTHAAKMLGISIRTLRNKLNEYRQEGLDI